MVVLTQSATRVNLSRLALKSRELYLKLGGTLPSKGKSHSGGTLILGGNLKSESTINHKGKLCPLHPIRGASLFKEIRMPPWDKMFRLHNNPLMEKCQTHPITLKTHPVILCSHMLLKTPQILYTLVKTNLI